MSANQTAWPTLFSDASESRAALAVVDVEGLLRRIVQDALSQASARQWDRRGRVLEACRPRPGDFTGRASAADLVALDHRCAVAAARCRIHARLLRGESIDPDGPDAALVMWSILGEEADRG